MKKKKAISLLLATAMAVSMAACSSSPDETVSEPTAVNEIIAEQDTANEPWLKLNADTKPASSHTIEANKQVYALLDFDDTTELDNATRGLIAAPDALEIRDADGKLVWSQDAYAFLDQDAPDTANPSLWRNAQLNHINGLFEVTEGIYQVRGYDMTNITFIKGNTGWIIVDPLMSVECSQAALELVKENLGDYPVKAVIYSHPHVDHFGGVRGVVDEEDVLSGEIPVIAPEGFEKHAISENIYAGNGMSRRASYMYGTLIQGGEAGSLSIGIGMGQSKGTASFISPTKEICQTGEKMTIDGIEFEFQMTPGTEAPVEMNFWIADKKALWMAENCTGTMHNLYTIRGAQVRDGNAWAEYIMEAETLFGTQAEVVFQSHNWPHWGNDVIQEYLTNTAAAYKFINDQTLLYINEGYTETEIANMIKLPEELEKVWYTRQYYGTVAHNAKAVYQKYMGWYDGNPIHLAELTPTDYAKKMMSYLGDSDAVLENAKADFENGEYQWVAQITNMLVYDDPSNTEARYLCADALEQLGYQAESGPWRNAYLCAADELRNGTNTDPATRAAGSADAIAHMTPEMIFDYLGILVDTEKVSDLTFTANVVLPTGSYVLRVVNGVLLYQVNAKAENADVTWTTNRMGLLSVVQKNSDAVAALITQDGDETCLEKLMDAVTVLNDYRYFNIIEP